MKLNVGQPPSAVRRAQLDSVSYLALRTSMTASDQTLARDPVCGMSVNPATAKHTYEHAGKNYFFCCAHCVEKFKADPQAYLNKPASSGLVMLGMPGAKPAAHIPATTIQPAPSPEVRKPAL